MNGLFYHNCDHASSISKTELVSAQLKSCPIDSLFNRIHHSSVFQYSFKNFKVLSIQILSILNNPNLINSK